MKVLYERPQWQSILAKMWKHLPTIISKGSSMLFRKDKRFGPFEKQLMIASAECWLKCYLVLTYCSNPNSAKRTDDQFMRSWSAAILTDSKVSEFCGCLSYIFPRVGLRKENEIPLFRNWFPSIMWGMVSIRKFSISCHIQYEIYIDFEDNECGLSAHWS